MRAKSFVIKIVDCFFLLRIFLLVPVWTVLIIGWIAGNSAIEPGGWILNSLSSYKENALWISLGGFSLIAAANYVINQIADIESDRINHKLFILPNGLISIRIAWICVITCALGGMATAYIFFDVPMIILYFCGLLLGILYSLPPFNLKNHAWGGVLANFLGHGVVTFLVGFYAANFGVQIGFPFIKEACIASLCIGFANAAVFLTTTIPDAAGDRITGKKTFCVVYGEKKTALAAAVCCTAAFIFSFTLPNNAWIMIVQSAVSLMLFAFLAVSPKKEFAFKTFRWPVFLLSTLVVVFIPVYGILIIFNLFISKLYYKKRFNFDYPTFKSK